MFICVDVLMLQHLKVELRMHDCKWVWLFQNYPVRMELSFFFFFFEPSNAKNLEKVSETPKSQHLYL